MQQTINLINTLPRKPQVRFSSIQLLIGALGIVAFWGMLYAIMGGYQNYLRSNLAQINEQNEQFSEQVKTHANSQFQQKKRELEAKIDKEKKQLKRHKQLAGVVKKQSGWENKGFVPFMQLLSDTLPDKAWLTGIDLMRGGKQIRLQGNTMDPAQMPHYVRQLNQQSLLKQINVQLDLLNIVQTKVKGVSVYRFDIKNE